MISKRNHTRQKSHNCTRVNLHVARIGFDMLWEVCHEGLVHFIRVDVFHHTRIGSKLLHIVIENNGLTGKGVHKSTLVNGALDGLWEDTQHQVTP